MHAAFTKIKANFEISTNEMFYKNLVNDNCQVYIV